MRICDQIDPFNLDRRQWELCMLALTVILTLAVGMALLMYPTALSNDLIVSGTTKRKIFFGFCALSLLLVGYFLDRQIVITQLRRRVVAIRHEASVDLLASLPGLDFFRDRLTMEHRRAVSTHLPLSLLVVQLKPSPQLPDKEEIDAAFGDAAKALISKLRAEDSIYLFRPGLFAIVLPGMDRGIVHRISTRFTEGLDDASGANTRFLFDLHLFSYPEDVSTAREMEEAARSFFPLKRREAQKVEAAGTTPRTADCPPSR